MTPETHDTFTKAAADVLSERIRQIEVEGWSPEHDDKHRHGELAQAAACYALGECAVGEEQLWPFDWIWWKPRGDREDLVKAGALILAEIERLDRLSDAIGGAA